jgi:SAM-dependent methyltransferase
MTFSRDDLIKEHIIHEFDRDLVISNLKGCHGQLMRRFYLRMFQEIVGNRVLDAGCGFGLFSKLCLEQKLSVHSIDIDENSLAIARSLYNLDCRNESIYNTSLPDNSIDTIVSNEAVFHFEIDRLLKEANRLGVKRIIIHDSNLLNPFLRSYWRAVGHEEYQAHISFGLINLFQKFHFNCSKLIFMNFISLPVSGGFQKRPLPLISRFPVMLYALDRFIEKALFISSLRQIFAFRFLAVFDNQAVH